MNHKTNSDTRPNFEDLLHFVGASGNVNILYSHISRLQLKLDISNHVKRDVVVDTVYFCWLMLFVNYIVLRIEAMYQMKGTNRLQDKHIADLVNLFIEDLKNYKIDFDSKRIYTIVELRHSFFHFGVPNLIRIKMNPKLKQNVKRCLKDYEYAKELFEEVKNLTQQIPSEPIEYGKSIRIG